MKPYQPSEKLVVRDSLSLSLDEDLSDDVEDDVFIRDGRTCRTYEDRGAKRPLMAPRRKNSKSSSGSSSPILKKYRRKRCWNCCEPFCYGLAAITVLIGLIVLAALLLTAFPLPLQKIKIWFHKESPFSSQVIRNKFNSLIHGGGDGNETSGNFEIVPCTQITVQKVWSRPISRVNSESPVRKYDVNKDGIEDVIIGYGIDEMIDNQQDFIPRCTSLKTGLTDMCGGGLLALNGATGETIWQRWTSFTIFSLQCSFDINFDGQSDCVAAGRGGLIISIDAKNGNIIWELKDYSDLETYSQANIDLYTINVVRDLDNDGVSEIIAVHVEEGLRVHGGHIKLISGATGSIIRSIATPNREEIFVPIQALVMPDGTDLLLVVTGGQNSPGGVYTTKLSGLMNLKNGSDYAPLMRIANSGFMVPAVLTDINNDSVEDIIVSSFNSTVYAFDGQNHTLLWSYIIPDSESVSSIVPGHFNHDNVTDFMVKYNTGPGFPIYYYSQTTILNGTNGQPFLDNPIKDSGGPNSLLAGLSVSQTYGGDFFLHWQLQCRDKYDTNDEYQFMPDSDVVQQSRADTCMLRYNASSVLKLYAITRHVEPPGAVIFSTDDLNIVLNQTETQLLKENYVAPIKHPKMKLKVLTPKPETQTVVVDKKKMESNKEKIREQMLNTNVVPENMGYDEDIKRQEKINMNKIYNKYNLNTNDQDLNVANINKPYIYLPYDQNEAKNPILMNPEQSEPLDYEYISDDDNRRYQRPRYRQNNPYSGGRDVRSKFGVFEDLDLTDPKLEETVYNQTNPNSQTKKRVLTDKHDGEGSVKKGSPETLWDLELEKEANEAFNDIENVNYDARNRRQSSNNTQNQTQPASTAINQNMLPTIASAGVLVKSLNASEISRIDYIFVMNIRESETYPPLFLEQDVTCVQEKMQAYRGFSNDEVIQLEKKFLKQCLKSRIPNLKPVYQKYETQIVITRIAITCSCGDNLDPKKEVCSKFNPIEQQKWTEYMGNAGAGIYPQ